MAKRNPAAGMVGFLFRYFLFILTTIVALSWFTFVILGDENGPYERKLNQLLSALDKSNPGAAKRIRAAAKKDPYSVAVAVATLKNQQNYEMRLTEFSESLKANEPNPFIEAISLSVDKGLVSNDEDRKKFIYAHGSFLYLKESELIKKALSTTSHGDQKDYKASIQAVVDKHFDLLKNFAKEPEIWAIVKFDPVAVAVYSEVEDPQLRKFYVENHDWVQDLFSQFQQSAGEKKGGPNESENEIVSIKSVLETAQRFYPETRQTVLDQKQNGCGLGPIGFQLFFKYGVLIKACVEKEKVLPLCETLEIFFAQTEYLDSFMEKHGSESAPVLLAREIGKIKKECPDLWRAAKASPGALDLYEDAPEFANAVFNKCDGMDVQILLYADYFQADRVLLKNAARALATWGQLAFYTLLQYPDHVDKAANNSPQEPQSPKAPGGFQDNNFKKALRADFRTVFYVATHGQEGIVNVLANPKYLDKDLDKDGKPKDESWWVNLPIVGGPLKVVNNYRNGYPNTWGEIGWGALDVADGALLIASLGATASATAGKQGAKAAAKAALKAALKEKAKVEGAKKFPNFFGSALGRFLGVLKSVDAHLLRIPSSLFTFAGKICNVSLWLAKAAIKTWNGLPSGFKSFVYKAFLAVSIAVSVALRTIPFLWDKLLKQIEKIPETIIIGFRDASNDLLDAIIKGLKEALGSRFNWRQVAYWAIFAFLGYLCFRFYPKSRLKYA